jgi:hypothetical protein
VGFEYIVDLDCPVKQAIPTGELTRLLKSREQARAVIELARRSGDKRSPDELTITIQHHTPEGTQSQPVSIAQLLEGTQRLDALATHCRGCPANVGSTPFGCYGVIPYPIRGETEDWVLERLPEDLDGTAGRLLRATLDGWGCDGTPLKRMRPDPMFFERRKAASRRWGSWWKGWRLDSNVVLEVLLCHEALEPTDCVLLTVIFGLVPEDVGLDDARRWTEEPASRRELIELARVPDVPEGQLDDTATYLKAILFGAILDERVLTSF